ncbi:DUF1223 domain-containing protein [Psychroserpens luteolus]|uniref:DUF1223 domain-containing protein n=1 Tax=Psychroserpens luteolus TaxID=2855840 RepID=UPI001E3A7981|nr:DUF1223 domain-containing protein [Psychroserpens luteolus]MCD2258776.1 DUF1223 domain-containing protein [Psychroserpens luteolus]
MKHILLTLFMIPLLFSTEKVETYPPITVLELFTSQGCSSCPPADKLLTAIQDRDDKNSVIALSYHVDYWNYIGWKDPFSKASFSDKQRSYSRKFNSSTIYTPQVVVNGKEHFVGSNEVVMKNKLKGYASIASKNKIDVTSVVNSQGNISFEYSIGGSIKNKVLRVALVIEERITKIARGENRNRTLKNSNIVILEDKLNLKRATGTHQLTIPKLVNKNDNLKLVFIMQNTDLDILGASQVNL